jgi:DNA-binding HxlR family transcriptional regulator
MITINIMPDDLVKMRFAYRPLLEIPLSYRVLINPEFQSPYRPWLEEVRHTLYDADLPYLSALVTGHGYIPDFLTPTPSTKHGDIEADFEALLATPDELIQDGILTLIESDGDSEMRRYFLAHPRAAIGCLVEELREYWRRTLVHYWSRMMSTLEGDLLYRARQLALDGPGALFEDLHSSVDFRNSQIQLLPVCQHLHDDVELTLHGEGIQIVPLIFRGCGRMFQVTQGWQPMLAYGVRGAGLWYQKPASSNQSLEHALGTGRARVLRVLQMPASNGEIAFKARISAATASQHLLRLTKAGLVQPQRSGKRVYYSLTERGVSLLALFETTD